MKKLLLIHGPNLNKLGERDPALYGEMTLRELELSLEEKAKLFGMEMLALQSNHEGALIDFIQGESATAAGMIINPGALTHYSYALHDAILDSKLPAVEVHLSHIQSREPWRAHSVIAPACVLSISGKKFQGYVEAIDYFAETLADED